MISIKNGWQRISYLGIKPSENELDKQSNILNNQLTALTAVIMFFLLLVIRTEGILKHEPMSHGTVRLVAMILILFICLLFNLKSRHSISRMLLIFLPPMVLLVLPVVLGYVEEENFFYYQYVVIGLSIIPQLLIIPNRNKLGYGISLAYYFLLTLFIDNIIVAYADAPFIAPKLYADFYIVYKVFPLAIFIFTAVSIYYLRKLNIQYEEALQEKNKWLDTQNEELISALDQLQKAQEKLVHQQKMSALGHLTAGVSHEINNPLNYIAGGVFLIEDELQRLKLEKPHNDNFRQASEMITDGIKRVSYIINLLDAFSNNKPNEKNTTDINKLLESSLCFITAKAKDKIKIIKEIGPVNFIFVVPDEIQRIILAIFDNAVGAIFEKPNITEHEFIRVSTYESIIDGQTMAVVEIENSGPQIGSEHLPHIFEPFYTTKSAGKGSGLNLSNAYSVITSYNGQIWVENTPKGVMFCLSIPVSN